MRTLTVSPSTTRVTVAVTTRFGPRSGPPARPHEISPPPTAASAAKARTHSSDRRELTPGRGAGRLSFALAGGRLRRLGLPVDVHEAQVVVGHLRGGVLPRGRAVEEGLQRAAPDRAPDREPHVPVD